MVEVVEVIEVVEVVEGAGVSDCADDGGGNIDADGLDVGAVGTADENVAFFLLLLLFVIWIILLLF